MKIQELFPKTMGELQQLLDQALLQKFQLRMQLAMGQIQKNHLVRNNRTLVARIKTAIAQKGSQS